jgi:cytochrome oxidase assembly protein ShyY1
LSSIATWYGFALLIFGGLCLWIAREADKARREVHARNESAD